MKRQCILFDLKWNSKYEKKSLFIWMLHFRILFIRNDWLSIYSTKLFLLIHKSVIHENIYNNLYSNLFWARFKIFSSKFIKILIISKNFIFWRTFFVVGPNFVSTTVSCNKYKCFDIDKSEHKHKNQKQIVKSKIGSSELFVGNLFLVFVFMSIHIEIKALIIAAE